MERDGRRPTYLVFGLVAAWWMSACHPAQQGPAAVAISCPPVAAGQQSEEAANEPPAVAAPLTVEDRAVELVEGLSSAARTQFYSQLPAAFKAKHTFDKLDDVLVQLERTLGELEEVRVVQRTIEGNARRFIMIAVYPRGAKVFVADMDEKGEPQTLKIRPLPSVEPPVGSEPAAGYVAAQLYSLPLRGEWRVSNGGPSADLNNHVGNLEQWYAFDFVGKDTVGSPSRNEDFTGYGEVVLAPADGTVVVVIDGVPETTPGERDEHVPAGNLIVIDHGKGEFSYLAHLRPGSILVKPGTRVTRGRKLAKVGNSGRSTRPHLHWHLASESLPVGGHGLPIRFKPLVVNGQRVDSPQLVRDDLVANP